MKTLLARTRCAELILETAITGKYPVRPYWYPEPNANRQEIADKIEDNGKQLSHFDKCRVPLIQKLSLFRLNWLLHALPSLNWDFKVETYGDSNFYAFTFGKDTPVVNVLPFAEQDTAAYSLGCFVDDRWLLLDFFATFCLLLAPDIKLSSIEMDTSRVRPKEVPKQEYYEMQKILTKLTFTNEEVVAAIKKMNTEMQAVIPAHLFYSRKADYVIGKRSVKNKDRYFNKKGHLELVEGKPAPLVTFDLPFGIARAEVEQL